MGARDSAKKGSGGTVLVGEIKKSSVGVGAPVDGKTKRLGRKSTDDNVSEKP